MLNDQEKYRYSRQINLPGICVEGQLRLKQARVLCIGAGGLGSSATLYLAAAGVGCIGIVDDDSVDLSNLPRQILFDENDFHCLDSGLNSPYIFDYQDLINKL